MAFASESNHVFVSSFMGPGAGLTKTGLLLGLSGISAGSCELMTVFWGEKFSLSLFDVGDVYVEVVVLDGLVGRGLDVGLEVREIPLSLVGGCGCCV